MDKRKLRLVLLGAVGIVILVIGIEAAIIYGEPDPILRVQRDVHSQYEFGRDWRDLNKTERDALLDKYPDLGARDSLSQSALLARRNAEFAAWIVKWIVKPVGLFAILTAALVVSRLILKEKD